MPTAAVAGLHNFVRTAEDYRFIPAALRCPHLHGRLARVLLVFVVGLALLLHGRANRASSTFRFLFYMPGALAGAASILVWLFMLDPAVSPGGFLLRTCSGRSCSSSDRARNLPFVFAMIAFWTGAGGWIVVMYGALNTIPYDLEEAARIDGAARLPSHFG